MAAGPSLGRPFPRGREKNLCAALSLFTPSSSGTFGLPQDGPALLSPKAGLPLSLFLSTPKLERLRRHRGCHTAVVKVVFLPHGGLSPK